MSVMKLDPEFFDREDVAAISGEFGAIGELVVIRLLCEIRKAGYYICWDTMRKMAFVKLIGGLTPDTLDRIVERLVEYGFFSRSRYRGVGGAAGVLTSADIQRRYIRETGAGRLRRRTRWPHLLIDPVEEGVVPAKVDAGSADEPDGVALRIDPVRPLSSQKWMKVRIRTADKALHVYRRVPNPGYKAASAVDAGSGLLTGMVNRKRAPCL